MDWLTLFSLLGGTTLVSLIVTTCFNSIKNSINRKKSKMDYLEEKEIKEKQLKIIEEELQQPLSDIQQKIQLLYKNIEDLNKNIVILKEGTQALLRAQLYELYGIWHNDKGYAPVDIKNNFENIYQKYHVLGANGVMDGLHKEFMDLPTIEEK